MPSGAVAKLIISWKEYSTDAEQPEEWRVPLASLCRETVWAKNT
ncbi:hypothetical protein [Vibrio diabolicus]